MRAEQVRAHFTGSKKPRNVTNEAITVNKPLFAKQPEKTAQFAAGDRVRHMTFGEGEIISVKPMGADTLYEIMFDSVGMKKLMATYARLKKV